MGLTVLEVEVENPANPEITEKVAFLIDSGTIYVVVPTPARYTTVNYPGIPVGK